jgi:hypothetical protein
MRASTDYSRGGAKGGPAASDRFSYSCDIHRDGGAVQAGYREKRWIFGARPERPASPRTPCYTAPAHPTPIPLRPLLPDGNERHNDMFHICHISSAHPDPGSIRRRPQEACQLRWRLTRQTWSKRHPQSYISSLVSLSRSHPRLELQSRPRNEKNRRRCSTLCRRCPTRHKPTRCFLGGLCIVSRSLRAPNQSGSFAGRRLSRTADRTFGA